MSDPNAQPGILNDIGQAILRTDNRWIAVFAVVLLLIFFLTLRFGKQKRLMSREDAINLGLAFMQLYSGPLIFSLLVLTRPPALDLVSSGERESVGLLAFIFLVSGVFMQIKKIWTGAPSVLQNSPASAQNDPQGAKKS